MLTVLVVALAVAFVHLGRWQLSRLDQRRDTNATVAEHERAPILPFDEAFGHEITDADQWRRVEVRGTYDADHQVVVRYRSHAGATGWEVVTPLDLADGRTVLVDRGFVERPPTEDFPRVAPAPPAGEVTVVGYVRRDERGGANAVTPDAGAVRLIDSAAIGAWLGRDLIDGYIGLISSDPPQQGFTVVGPPAPDEGPHLSYALQWFAFAGIAGLGLVVFIRNDVRDRRRMRARAAAADPGARGH